VSEATAKPYLIRALYEWCGDQGFTPYLAVRVTPQTRVPTNFVRDGEITLNISATATQRLTMDNEWILFNARFNGVSQEVAVPMAAVMGLYARETGYGMGFAMPQPSLPDAAFAAPTPVVTSAPASTAAVPAAAIEADSVPPEDGANVAEKPAADTGNKAGRSRSHLSVVK
jgi:stringent starvation protein B